MPKTKVKRLILKQFKVATDRLMHIPGLNKTGALADLWPRCYLHSFFTCFIIKYACLEEFRVKSKQYEPILYLLTCKIAGTPILKSP
ncbi:hypothetical protein DN752_09920 [Echinicola strongylocentroti]|uniref:Uncharacterized protein n=1 Tax=Echinicola strongylocentroti TaxID=1795355 RepID=A0A2Z4IH32_9BACT|nr:hypothetical protein DN752_09920 [Echinicola strongylocentroti]